MRRAARTDTSSEAYRHECEVRYVANLPSRDDRRRYLEGVSRKRGLPAVEQIIVGLKAIYTRMAA